MTYEDCTIENFMSCWFSKDYSNVSEQEFKIIYAQYLDASGLFLTEDFERISLIRHLNQRLNYVKLFIKLQRNYIIEFDKPFLRPDEFETLKQEYGYVLVWREDLVDFENQLKRIESKEIKHNSFLEGKIKELNDSRKDVDKEIKIENDEEKLKKSRISFIRMLNSLGKIGFKLDRKTTFVEELALMIRQQIEDSEEQSNRYGR